MRYLFFLVWFLYTFVFYFFYTYSVNKDLYLKDLVNKENITVLSLKDNIIFSSSDNIVMQSFFWNLLIETTFFLVLSIFLFFLFSNIKIKKSSKNEELEPEISDFEEENEEKISIFAKIFNKENFAKFLNKFSYYIWFLLLYISLYIISKSIEWITFSMFILFLNVIFYLYFFLSKFSSISRDFLKINSIIFSLWYLFCYVFIMVTNINFFSVIDFINSFLIILLFPSLMYYDKFVVKKPNFDYAIVSHFSIYIFGVFLFYFYHYILNENLIYYLCILSSLFWVLWFDYLPNLELFKKDKVTFRYIWIIFSYFWIFLWFIYLLMNYNFVILLIIIFQCIYNFYIHKKYWNYISLIISNLLFVFSIFYTIIYFWIFDYKSINFFLFSLILSVWMIIYTYLFKAEIYLDYYIIHFFSYIVNIIWVVLFFIFINFDILYIWILLLVESIYFFLSYFRLTKKL